jgi:hypothetical protein
MRWATRADPNPDSSYRRRVARLDQVEQELLTLVKQQGAVPLLPQRNELPPEALAPAPGRTTVEMVVELHDGLQARVLQGTLVAVGPENCVIWDVKPAPAAAAGGFILLTSRMGERTVVFQLQRTGNAAGALPRGPLLTVTLEIGAGAGAVYTLNVEGVWAEPARSIWGGSNALIVPPAV